MAFDWWKRLPKRLLREEESVLALYEGEYPVVKSHHWKLHDDREPRLFVTLGLKGLDLEIRFPGQYPDGCPAIRPVPHNKRISSHQYTKSGILCLELGPDNWHSHYTASDMIRSAWKLVALETISEVEYIDIPSRHTSDLTEQIALGDGVFLWSTQFRDALQGLNEETVFEYVMPSRNLLRVAPTAVPEGEKLKGVPPAFLRETSGKGLIVPLNENAPTTVPKEPAAFDEFVKIHSGIVLEKHFCVVLVRRDGTSCGYIRLPDGVLELVNMELAPSNQERTPDVVRQALDKLRVGIVGLGSMGSKIAVSLARSGVRDFVLVDRKVLTPDNICRNAASFIDVGAQKTRVVKELIRDVCPQDPQIEILSINLASSTNPELHAKTIEMLGACDLLVDATANPDAFCLLAMIASDHQRPIVWAEVYGGGLGGMVASAHPEHTPCPRCVRAAFLSETQNLPPAPGSETETPYAGDEETPLIATDADVSYIAAATTIRAVALLEGRSDTGTVQLLGLRCGWIFDEPMQSRSIPVRKDDWSCDRCWQLPSEAGESDIALAEALFMNEEHAHDSRST